MLGVFKVSDEGRITDGELLVSFFETRLSDLALSDRALLTTLDTTIVEDGGSVRSGRRDRERGHAETTLLDGSDVNRSLRDVKRLTLCPFADQEMTLSVNVVHHT